jgi:hypothetical protein
MLPSMTAVAPEVRILNHVAVLVATALTLDGSVGLNTPADEAGAKGEPSVCVDSSVCVDIAVAGPAGCVPS